MHSWGERFGHSGITSGGVEKDNSSEVGWRDIKKPNPRRCEALNDYQRITAYMKDIVTAS